MSNFINTPTSTINNPTLTTTSTPMAMNTGAPLMPGATATTMLPNPGVMTDNRHLSKQERKALKHQNKALKHDHQHGHGLPGTGVPLAGGATRGTGLGTVMRGATNVVEHQPIVEREVIVERPVEVRREHHIQPVIHEREHQIQPVVRTEVTTERKDLVTDRNVMMPAVVEQPRVATTGLLHQTTTDQRGIMPGAGTTGMTGAHHATIGQKIKGTVKEVQGSLTHNPMKKEEGRLLKQGIEPTTAGMGTTPGMLGNTGTTTRF
ncbi:uncharacterized protein ACA1_290930 [Acanthamoeba castellanii str. Neff]|uniref:Uncharacterized protein n=1 Tax=Acanthamoeba castellanii (strain ATCC 30010 / Neff) TaxID=1257118 RepID=L8HJE2_ACACF|nr:uncharacterized protein ACA1_290930 [Acanthamoeba castellanii str. Neff]ELR25315.1 hypothetical protein ACA1_290930 [Acanthamoeba castellanii str. Neff]